MNSNGDKKSSSLSVLHLSPGYNYSQQHASLSRKKSHFHLQMCRPESPQICPSVSPVQFKFTVQCVNFAITTKQTKVDTKCSLYLTPLLLLVLPLCHSVNAVFLLCLVSSTVKVRMADYLISISTQFSSIPSIPLQQFLSYTFVLHLLQMRRNK